MYFNTLSRKYEKTIMNARENSAICLNKDLKEILSDKTIPGVWCFGFENGTNYYDFKYSEIFFLTDFELKTNTLYPRRDAIVFKGYPFKTFAETVASKGKTKIDKSKEKKFKHIRVMLESEINNLISMNTGDPIGFIEKGEEIEFKKPLISIYNNELVFMSGEIFNENRKNTPIGIDIKKISKHIIESVEKKENNIKKIYLNKAGVSDSIFLSDEQCNVLNRLLKNKIYARLFTEEDVLFVKYQRSKVEEIYFKIKNNGLLFSNVQLMSKLENNKVAIYTTKNFYISIKKEVIKSGSIKYNVIIKNKDINKNTTMVFKNREDLLIFLSKDVLSSKIFKTF